MPPRANAIAPTLDKAAMSAPVKAKPEPAFPVKAKPEPQVVAMVMVVDAESPEAPVATIVYDCPGVVSDGIVTVVELELVEFAVIVPNVVPCSVKVTDSFGSKLTPFTVKDPPGTEHPEFAVIPIAFGL